MMQMHKEGNATFRWYFIITILLNSTIWYINGTTMLFWTVLAISLLFLIPLLIFFRNPERTVETLDNNLIYSPCDGKVVTIEEVDENEYFKDKRIQVSIFMSPLNVHVNRNPIGGEVKYSEYHPGKYLVAWHPKSSTENERTTVVLSNGKNEVLFRQIAGALARRIVNYLKVGQKVSQGEDMGFIKFGSRVDVFLPLNAKINVKMGDIANGNETVIAEFRD
jgi:phosphatidylserine decarboxylase